MEYTRNQDQLFSLFVWDREREILTDQNSLLQEKFVAPNIITADYTKNKARFFSLLKKFSRHHNSGLHKKSKPIFLLNCLGQENGRGNPSFIHFSLFGGRKMKK